MCYRFLWIFPTLSLLFCWQCTHTKKHPSHSPLSSRSPLPKHDQTRPPFKATLLKKLIHQKINIIRKQHRIRLLKINRKLDQVATFHSKDMAQNSFFEHINLKKENPTQRAKRQGYECRLEYEKFIVTGVAENIARNNLAHSMTKKIRTTQIGNQIIREEKITYDWKTIEQIAESTVSGWMKSPGHRKNILTPHFQTEGLGIAVDKKGRIFITQNFC